MRKVSTFLEKKKKTSCYVLVLFLFGELFDWLKARHVESVKSALTNQVACIVPNSANSSWSRCGGSSLTCSKTKP